MIKVRKLMSLVMVFALVVSMTTIGASASDEITAVTCEEVICDEVYDTNATDSLVLEERALVEEVITEGIENNFEDVSKEENITSNDVMFSETEYQQEISLENTDFTEISIDEDLIEILLDGQVSLECESETLEASSTGGETYDPNGPSLDSCDVLIEGNLYYSLAFEALTLINEIRIEKGLDPLIMDSAALEFAMMRAYECALYCTHNRPNGAGFTYGCSTSITGENIAAGCKTAEAAVNGWVNSIGHYSTMVNSSFVSTGIGVFKVGSYYFWVQSFSREDGTTVYASNYSDQSVSAIVNIADYRIEEKINPCLTDSNLKVGETASFEVWFIEQNEKLYPCKYELPAEGMIYTSSNESVVTVSANGVVTAVGEGTATITATYPGYDLEPWAFDITVCNHDSGYTSDVTTEPTCDTDGVRVYTCGDCGDSYTESIDKLGHTWDFGVITEPSTCISTGIRTYTCEVCGDTKTGTIITTVHNYDDGVVTTEPTCGASGVKTYTCGTCGATKTEKISPTYNHTYDDGVVGLPATCSTSGTLIHTCTGCGIKMTTYVAATNEHILSDEPTLINEPTCTSYGSKGYFCESCGQMIGSVILIDPVAHDYIETITTQPTCTGIGSADYVCSSCGAEKTSQLAPLGHTWDEGAVTKEPTCTAKGVTTYTCETCNRTRTATNIAATGHSYEFNSTTKAATCTTDGQQKETCTKCASTRYVTVAALGHSEVVDPAVEATCTDPGLSAGSHCERCGLVITAQTTVATTDHSYSSKVVSPTCTTAGYTEHTCASCGDTYQDTPVSSRGHNWDAGTVTTASKCESAGIMTYACEDCSATKEEVIAATGHSYGKAVTDPTCETQGYTMYTCAGCGDSYRSDYIDKLGHTMDDGVIQTPATCTEAGSILYSCRECSATTTKEIAATGHSWDDGVVTTVPTCTEEGVKTYTCEHDATHTKTEVIASTGHSYTDTVYAPTCEEGGYTTHTCETCGNSYEDASTSPTGHTWDEGVVTEAATTEDTGVMTYTCTVCGQTKDEDIPCIEETSILRGDVDENGLVDIIDCVRLVRYNAGYDVKINYDAADMTGDGNINTFDVVRLMKYIAGYAV